MHWKWQIWGLYAQLDQLLFTGQNLGRDIWRTAIKFTAFLMNISIHSLNQKQSTLVLVGLLDLTTGLAPGTQGWLYVTALGCLSEYSLN
jgi:hypothetical protein